MAVPLVAFGSYTCNTDRAQSLVALDAPKPPWINHPTDPLGVLRHVFFSGRKRPG